MLGGAANATATSTGGNAGTSGVPTAAGAANATSFATTINGNMAQALSTALGSSGQAQATAQTNFGGLSSVQSIATSPVSGTATSANAVAQAGGSISVPVAINAGQSFSVVGGFAAAGPLTTLSGAMGAGYGGTGQSLTYEESAYFTSSQSQDRP
jgi:hypothetical protein